MLILALLLSSFAQADSSFTCSATAANGDALEAVFSLSRGDPSSALRVNGVDAPSLSPCQRWAHGNHEMNSEWRCPHELGGVRYELYPAFPKDQGTPSLRVIRWAEDAPELIQASRCR